MSIISINYIYNSIYEYFGSFYGLVLPLRIFQAIIRLNILTASKTSKVSLSIQRLVFENFSNEYHYGIYKTYFNKLLFFLPVYLSLGNHHDHIGLMIAMEEMKLFDHG